MPAIDADRPAATAGDLILVACAAMLWGTVGIAAKTVQTLAPIHPLAIGFWRIAFAVPVLVLVGWHRLGPQLFWIDRRDLPIMLLLAAATALYQVFYFAAVAAAGVALATLVTICSAPVMVAVLASALGMERPTLRLVATLAAAVTGTAMMVGGPGEAAADAASALRGALLALGSALGFAVFALCSRRLAPDHPPARLIVFGFGGGAVLLAPFAAAAGLAVSSGAAGWGVLLYLGLVPTGLAYVLFFSGMRRVPATVASIVTLLEPLTATLLAWALFGERLGALGMAGAGLLLAALVASSLRPAADLPERAG